MPSLFDRFVAMYGRLPTEFDKDYLELLNMTKYRIVPVPDFNPAKCSNCGSSKGDGRQYIDFGLQVDWYGVVYICGFCLRDIARAMDLFKPLEDQLLTFIDLADRIKNLQELGAKLHDTLKDSFKEFEKYYANLHSLSDNSVANSAASLGPDKRTNKPTITGNKPTVAGAETRAAKPTPVARSKNVPSLAELLENS